MDQLIFILFGGRLQHPLLEGSDIWQSDSAESACRAPLSLLGSGYTFVEIGANDGLHMSNSWFFEHFLGWRGMCAAENPRAHCRQPSLPPRALPDSARPADSADYPTARRSGP